MEGGEGSPRKAKESQGKILPQISTFVSSV